MTPAALWSYHDAVRPQLYRFPAVDEAGLVAAVEAILGPRPAP